MQENALSKTLWLACATGSYMSTATLDSPDKLLERRQRLRSRFTLPDHKNVPAQSLQLQLLLPIAQNIGSDFFTPECGPSLRPFEMAAIVSVPKASVYEDHCPVLWQYDIRPSWQVPTVEPKTKSGGMKLPPDNYLWFGIATPDRGHISAS